MFGGCQIYWHIVAMSCSFTCTDNLWEEGRQCTTRIFWPMRGLCYGHTPSCGLACASNHNTHVSVKRRGVGGLEGVGAVVKDVCIYSG